MTFEEIVAQMKEAVDGIRKAIYGVQVREYIAKGMENVVEVGKQTIGAAKAAKASEEAAKTGVRIKLLEMVHGTDVNGISFVSAFDTMEGVELTGVWNKAASRVDF